MALVRIHEKTTITWLNANIKHYTTPEDWPANSPDQFVIESFWSIMATAVHADPDTHSLQVLKHRLRKA